MNLIKSLFVIITLVIATECICVAAVTQSFCENNYFYCIGSQSHDHNLKDNLSLFFMETNFANDSVQTKECKYNFNTCIIATDIYANDMTTKFYEFEVMCKKDYYFCINEINCNVHFSWLFPEQIHVEDCANAKLCKIMYSDCIDNKVPKIKNYRKNIIHAKENYYQCIGNTDFDDTTISTYFSNIMTGDDSQSVKDCKKDFINKTKFRTQKVISMIPSGSESVDANIAALSLFLNNSIESIITSILATIVICFITFILFLFCC